MIDKYQQQILFDELDTKSADNQQEPENQVIFENDAWQPEVEELAENNEIIEKSKPLPTLTYSASIFLYLFKNKKINLAKSDANINSRLDIPSPQTSIHFSLFFIA